MSDRYDPEAPLDEDLTTVGKLIATIVPNSLAAYRKLVISVYTTGAPLVAWLSTSAHSAKEIAGASALFLLTNYGVYKASNEE